MLFQLMPRENVDWEEWEGFVICAPSADPKYILPLLRGLDLDDWQIVDDTTYKSGITRQIFDLSVIDCTTPRIVLEAFKGG